MFLSLAGYLQTPFLRYPDIYRDQVAFTSEGDIWIGNWRTGETKRLTVDTGVERDPSFSPDGKWISFSGEYDGTRQAYIIPSTGGIPRKLTSIEGVRTVTGWTQDGKSIVTRLTGFPTNYRYVTVPIAGGLPKDVPLEFASHISMGPTEGDFAFTRFNRWSMAWFNYIGGMANQIWIRQGGKFRELTQLSGTSEFPVWLKDRIYFANEQGAKFSLMSVPVAGGKPRVEIEASPLEIRELSTDGEKLVFEKGTEVVVFDPASKAQKPLDIALASDLIHMQRHQVASDKVIGNVSITPTGKRVLVESRGQVLSLPVGEGEAKIWKAKPGVRYRTPSMSPDAKLIAYFGDEAREMNLYVANADGTGERQITHEKNGQLVYYIWSPDSKSVLLYDSKMRVRLVDVATGSEKLIRTASLAWAMPLSSFSPDSRYIATTAISNSTIFGQVEIYDTKTDKTEVVSDKLASDAAAEFSRDGNYLVLLSTRNLLPEWDMILNQLNTSNPVIALLVPLRSDVPNPLAPKDGSEPVKTEEKKPEEKKADAEKPGIEFDGFMDRRIELPIPPGKWRQISMVDGKVLVADGEQIKVLELASKSVNDLTSGPGFNLSTDGKKLLVAEGAKFRVIDIDSGAAKPASFGGLRLTVEPAREWENIYWDSWRLLRDYFYVENMHGVDWNAIGERYSKFLPNVHSRDDLDELIRWLQAELGSSHQYIAPGDRNDSKARVASGGLGIDIAEDPSGFYKITKLIRGDRFRTADRSPLLNAGPKVTEGMFLIEVAGVPAKVGIDPFENLLGRAGQVISVKVNSKPTAEGATTLMVKPVASENRMRKLEWAEQNRKYVTEKTKGRIGYIYVGAMGELDMRDFIIQFLAQRDKEAIVFDDRFNNGGNIQEAINRILSSRLSGFFNMRNSKEQFTRQQDFFDGPMACLINEFDISCGEEFPHRFRDLKLGPIIGRRTMGGEVGSDPGWPLIDGGTIMVPNYGFWSPTKGWEIEGRGVEPDIDVPSDPAAFVQGRDPQMDKAIEVLMKKLPATPPAPATQPKDRDRSRGGR
jgi:tricorn protease